MSLRQIACGAVLLGLLIVAPWVASEEPSPTAKPPEPLGIIAAVQPVTAEGKIWAKLNEPFTLTFDDASFEKFVASLKDAWGVPIAVDKESIAAENRTVPTSATASFAFRGLKNRSALGDVLLHFGLDWTIHDETLWITTRKGAERLSYRMLYDVGDLTRRVDDAGKTIVDREQFSDMVFEHIHACIRGFDWEPTDKISLISLPETDVLTVDQPRGVQEAVEEMIEAWRQMSAQPQHWRASKERRWRIESALEKPFELTFVDEPLSHVAKKLGEATGVPFIVDASAIRSAEIDPNVEISFDSQDCSIRSALVQMLRRENLAWTVKNESVFISTHDVAEERLDLSLFDVTDLTRFANDAKKTDEARDALVEKFESSVWPTTWIDVGGRGMLQLFVGGRRNILIVHQYAGAEQEFAGVLDVLQNPKTYQKGERTDLANLSRDPEIIEKNRSIIDAMSRPFGATFEREPLSKVCEALSTKWRIPLEVDRRELSNSGLETNIAVSMHRADLSRRAALRVMLDAVELTTLIDDGRILITTKIRADQCFGTSLFEISDFRANGPPEEVDDGSGSPTPQRKHDAPECQFGEPFEDANDDGIERFDALTDMITSVICPSAWVNVGGQGSLKTISVPQGDLLIVSQTADRMDEIEALLANVRRLRSAPPNEEQARSAKQSIEQRLTKKIDLSCADMPLPEICERLESLLAVPIFIDVRALVNEGIDPNLKATLRVRQAPGRSALNALALTEPEGLRWRIEGEFVSVTTAAKIELMLPTSFWNVTDLTRSVDANGPRTDVEWIAELISSTIAPSSWRDVGGSGSVRICLLDDAELLVVSQTDKARSQIDLLLAALRGVLNEPRPGSTTRFDVATSEERRIKMRLTQPCDVELESATLDEMAATLGDALGATVVIDPAVYDQEGFARDRKSSFKMHGKSGAETLDVLLSPLELAYAINDDLIWINPRATKGAFMRTAAFDVTDLVCDEKETRAKQECLEALRSLIEQALGPEKWSLGGGQGAMVAAPLANSAVLCVLQTPDELDAVDRLHGALRRLDPSSSTQITPDADQTARLFDALQQPCTWTFDSTPLRKTLESIADDLGVTLRVDWPLLDRSGLDTAEQPITFNRRGLSKLQALESILAPRGGDWSIDGGGLVVASPANLKPSLTAKLYDVTDLTRFADENGQAATQRDELLATLGALAAPGSWETSHHAGAATKHVASLATRDVLIVRQTYARHVAITRLLADLRRIRDAAKAAHPMPNLVVPAQPTTPEPPPAGGFAAPGGPF